MLKATFDEKGVKNLVMMLKLLLQLIDAHLERINVSYDPMEMEKIRKSVVNSIKNLEKE